MALSNINFIKGQGGLGYPLQGFDHYSGIVFYNNSTPSGLSASNQSVIYQTSDAETLGINSTSFAVERYHINEYFRQNKQGVLYINWSKTETTYSFSAVTDLQNYSNGAVRQFGVIQKNVAFATSQVQTLQSVATALEVDRKAPASILYVANMGTGSTSAYNDLTTLNANKVSVVVGQDMAGAGYSIYTATTTMSGTAVSILGAALGVVSKAKVSDSVAWVGAYNVSDGTELETIGFTDASLYRAYSDSALNALDAKGYVFLRKYVGANGTWFSSSVTATASNSDYNSIENNRVIDKAVRQSRIALLPFLNSPIKVNSDGTLTNDLVQFYKTTAKGALENMLSNSEISALDVIINPNQNVLSTKTLNITLQIVPIGSAKFINVTIGFVAKIG